MAITATERDVEAWVRETHLPKQLKQKFAKQKAKLSPGGRIELDAVSSDEQVVAIVSTAGYESDGGMLKVRAAAFFLLQAEADKKMMIFTEPDMHDAWQQEQIKGRLPADIRLVKVELPSSLRRRLDAEKKKSTD